MKTLINIIAIVLFFSIACADDVLKKGEELLKNGNYLQAKEFFKKFTEDAKVADRALLGLAKAEYFLGNYYEATIPLKRVLRDFKNSSTLNEANLYMGLTYLKIGRLRDAEYYFEKVQQPLEKQAMIGKGWIAFYKGDLRTVQAVLQRLDRKDFEDPETDLLRIKYLAMTDKAHQALKEFNKNLKLRKTLYDLDRADVLIRASKFTEAENILKKFIEKSNKLSDTIKAKKMLFDMYLTQGRTQEALRIGKEIYFYIPTDDVRLKIYSIYMNSKNYDEALRMLFVFRDKELKNKKIEEFLKTITNEAPEKASAYIVKLYPFLPADSSLLLQSAQFLISQGRYNEAKNLLRKVQTGPRRTEAVIPYSKILIKEGKYKEAKRILEPLKDKNSEATALYAQILAQEGDKLTALSYLRNISKTIKDTEILTLLGDLEYSNGDRKKAIHYWLEASRLGNAEAALKAADYFYLSKKIKEAIQYYKKAIDAGIKDNDSLMWAYYQYGKLAHDKTYLEKVAASKGELSEAAKELLH